MLKFLNEPHFNEMEILFECFSHLEINAGSLHFTKMGFIPIPRNYIADFFFLSFFYSVNKIGGLYCHFKLGIVCIV